MEAHITRDGGAQAPVYMPLSAVARQMGTRDDYLLPYIRRAEDPMPVRWLAGKSRYGFVIVEELNAWLERNTVGWAGRGKGTA